MTTLTRYLGRTNGQTEARVELEVCGDGSESREKVRVSGAEHAGTSRAGAGGTLSIPSPTSVTRPACACAVASADRLPSSGMTVRYSR